MSFKQQVVVDCRGHLLGRLASTVAKELLNGQQVVCVRTEDINISGSLYRNKLKYAMFKKKRMNSNPRRVHSTTGHHPRFSGAPFAAWCLTRQRAAPRLSTG